MYDTETKDYECFSGIFFFVDYIYQREREKTYDRFLLLVTIYIYQQKYKGRVISLSLFIFLVSCSLIIFTFFEPIFYPVPHFSTSSSHAGEASIAPANQDGRMGSSDVQKSARAWRKSCKWHSRRQDCR